MKNAKFSKFCRGKEVVNSFLNPALKDGTIDIFEFILGLLSWNGSALLTTSLGFGASLKIRAIRIIRNLSLNNFVILPEQ
ncbi:MAG: hypothetical protein HY738_23495 [Bacteroidia bacterium]|nr:hypothetical protein [Bacteroidia bacterium]